MKPAWLPEGEDLSVLTVLRLFVPRLAVVAARVLPVWPAVAPVVVVNAAEPD